MEPNDFVRLRPRRDGALEVDVVALGNVVRIETGAEFQANHRGICNGSQNAVEIIQSCVKTFLLSSENHPHNVSLPTPQMPYGATFQLQLAIPGTWQEYFTRLCISPWKMASKRITDFLRFLESRD